MNRRDLLGAMFAACAAPAIVRADSLMRVIPNETWVYGIPPINAYISVLVNLGDGERVLKKSRYIVSTFERAQPDLSLAPVLLGCLIERHDFGGFSGYISCENFIKAWKRQTVTA
jgi:hypothetical protein